MSMIFILIKIEFDIDMNYGKPYEYIRQDWKLKKKTVDHHGYCVISSNTKPKLKTRTNGFRCQVHY